MSRNYKVEEFNDISHITDEFGYWFSGIVDGEGCFCITIQKSGYKGENGKKLQLLCEFLIGLNENDEEVLDYISNNLIGFRKLVSKPDKRYNGKAMITLRISKRDVIRNIIIPLFDKYQLKSIKRKDYLIWREAAMKLANGEIKTDQDIIEIAKLRDSKFNKGGTSNRKSWEDLEDFIKKN